MKAILESYNQRQLDILYLLYSSDDWMTIKEISTLLNVTKQTINNDIKKLNNLTTDKLIIDTSTQLGIKIGEVTAQDIIHLKTTILRQSITTRFIRSIFFHPDKNLNYHADALYTSRSTLHRYVTIINKKLDMFSITIKQSNKGLFLHSDEENELRRFLAILLSEIFGFDNSLFIESDLLIAIDNHIEGVFSSNLYISTGDCRVYLQNFYYVSILRESQRFELHSVNLSTNHLIYTENLIKQKSDYLIPLTNDKLVSIDSFLMNYFSEHDMSVEEKNNLKLIENQIKSIIIQHVIKPNEAMISFFISSITTAYINKIKSKIPDALIYDQHQMFIDEINNHYPNLLKLILTSIHQLEKTIGVQLHPSINHIVFNLFISFPDIVDVAYSGTILIISSHSIEHARFLKKIICNHIDLNINFSDNLICTTEKNIYSTKDYKLIITDSIKVHSTYKNSFLVNNYPSNESLTQLRRQLASISMKKETCKFI